MYLITSIILKIEVCHLKEVLVAQLCLTLCYPKDYSPPGSSVHGIFRQEYWSGFPFPSPEDLPDPGVEPMSPGSPALAGRFFIVVPPGKHCYLYKIAVE